MPEVIDVAPALKGFGGDPRRAEAFAAVLGFEPVPSPVDLLGPSGGPTPLRESFEVRGDFFGVQSLFRIGSYQAGAVSAGLYAAELHEWGQRSSVRDRARRRVARAVVEHSDDARALVVLAPQELERAVQPEIEIVLPRVRTDSDSRSAFTTVRALVDTSDPSRFHRDRIRALALAPNLSIAQVADQWRRAFSVEEVTRKFYSNYAAVRDRIAQELAANNPEHAVVHELIDKERKDWATRQLGRVLFLWFLQAKRWLGYDGSGEGPTTYLAELWDEIQAEGGGYYRRVLRPLFFEAMALPLNRRSAETKDLLGEIPYLNGGLFRTNALEDRIEDGGPVDLPDTLFEPDPERATSVLGLFSRYHFTTRESTPDDQSVDPDPELLGRVFENLYQGDARRDSGTYYTPREIVHFMCRQALHGWLSDHIDGGPDLIERVRLQAIEPQDVGEGELIAPGKARRLEEALDAVRICDPAVGSGAFLLGAMQEIVQLRRGLALAAGQLDADIDLQVAEWKRRAIQWSLYGVDNNPEAVEICHLRLWLSLVLDLDNVLDVEPLPNLDFRVVAGDSLIDRVGDIVLPESLPVSDYVPPLEIGGRVGQDRRLIERWKLEFEAEHASPRRLRELRDNIVRAVQRILTAYVDAELSRERQAADAPDPPGLFTRQQRRQRDRERRVARERVQLLERAHADLHTGRGFWRPFVWPVLFHEVFQDNGFDLVLANPPYVRQERISADEQIVYKGAFSEVYVGTADLLVFFYARALQILREDGWLAFVTSSSFTKRNYGKKLQECLARQIRLSHVIDFGEAAIFEATVEPYVLVGKKTPPRTDHEVHTHNLYPLLAQTLGRGAGVETTREYLTDLTVFLDDEVSTLPQHRFTRGGWRIDDPAVLDLFERLINQGTPLGEFVNGRIYYGIKTGLNHAFVVDQTTREALVTCDPRSNEIIRPWVRGRDIKRWSVDWAGLYVLHIPWTLDISEYPAIEEHLSKFKEKLQKRPEVRKGVFPWFCLSRWAAGYHQEFYLPKIVWPDIARQVRFGFDVSGSYLNDKGYIMPANSVWILALLNSTLFEFIICQITNSLRGGFLQMKRQYTTLLPIVTPDKATERNLESIAKAGIAGEDIDANELDTVACNLYGLSRSEVALIDSWFERRNLHSRVSITETS